MIPGNDRGPGGGPAAEPADPGRREDLAVPDRGPGVIPPRWIGRTLWVLAIVAILGPFLVLPVTLEAGEDAGDEVSLARIARAFHRALASTGWNEPARMVIWGVAGVALLGAFSLLWVAFSDDDGVPPR